MVDAPSEEVHQSMPDVGRHTILHGLVTAMLALGYATVVIFLAAFLSPAGGGSGLAVAVATLAAAALLWPAWRRLQNTLNRRFDRPRVRSG